MAHPIEVQHYLKIPQSFYDYQLKLCFQSSFFNNTFIEHTKFHYNKDIISLKEHFQKRVETLEKAAQAILNGIQHNQYMVFTLVEIRMRYWFQRKI